MPVQKKQIKQERLATETVALPIYYTKSGKPMGETLKIAITMPRDWRQKTTRQKSAYILKHLRKAHSEDFATIRHKPSKDEVLGTSVARIKRQISGAVPENLLVPVAKAIKQLNDATERMITEARKGGIGKLVYPNLPHPAMEAWNAGKMFYFARPINITPDRSTIKVTLPVYDSVSGEKLGETGLPLTLSRDWRHRTAEQRRKYIRGQLARFHTSPATIRHSSTGLPVSEAMKQIKKAATIREYTAAVNVYKNGKVVGQAVLTVRIPDNLSESEIQEHLEGPMSRLNKELEKSKRGTLKAPGEEASAAEYAAFTIISERMLRKMKATPRRMARQ